MFKNSKILDIFKYAEEKRITTIAGAWVFFFLSALIPLTFLLVTAYGVFGVDVSMDIVSRLPEQLRENATSLVETAQRASNGVTIFFIFSVIFSGSALMRQMLKDGCKIYGHKRETSGIFITIKGVFALFVLFIIFLLSALLLVFGEYLLDTVFFGVSKRLTTVLATLVITVASYGVFLLINRFISPISLKKSALFSCSLITLTIVFIGTIGLKIYVDFFSRFNAFYGSMAGIVGFLTWTYVCMLGLVIGVVSGEFFQRKVF